MVNLIHLLSNRDLIEDTRFTIIHVTILSTCIYYIILLYPLLFTNKFSHLICHWFHSSLLPILMNIIVTFILFDCFFTFLLKIIISLLWILRLFDFLLTFITVQLLRTRKLNHRQTAHQLPRWRRCIYFRLK